LRIDQGVAMDRPSLLDATARKEHGKVTEVSVGRRATIIGHGIITIPPRDRQTERAARWWSVKSRAWQAHFLGRRLVQPGPSLAPPVP
jgi:hypothetical protein